ncbi:MAG: hypothetical protein WC989_02535 [Micavibrio sp.]
MRKDGAISIAGERFKRVVGPVFERSLGCSQIDGREAAGRFLTRAQTMQSFINNMHAAMDGTPPKPENNHEPR